MRGVIFNNYIIRFVCDRNMYTHWITNEKTETFT